MRAVTKNLLLMSALVALSCISLPSVAACITVEMGGIVYPDPECGAPSGTPQPPALGTPVDKVSVKDANGVEQLTLPLKPSTPLATPAGWSGPTSPPSTATAATQYGGNLGAPFFDNRPAAANAGCTAAGRGTGVAIDDTWYNCSTPYGGCSVGAPSNCVQYTTQTVCPAGYTASGGACNLTSAGSVVKPSDNKPGFTRSGNTLVPDSQDPDNATLSGGNATGTMSQPNSSEVRFDTADGRRVTVTIGSDGKTTITQSAPTGRGDTETRTTVVGAPTGGGSTSGNVEGTSRQVVAGTGSGAGTGTKAGESTEPCPAGPCATEATLADLRNKVAAGVKQDEQASAWSTPAASVGTAQTASKSTLDALTAKGTAASASGAGSDLASGLGNLSLPSSQSNTGFWSTYFPAPATCSAISFGASGRFAGMSMDPCPALNALKPVIEWGLFLLTALVIYQSWFGRREGGA